MTNDFTYAGARAAGFLGFVALHSLDITKVPTGSGVYLVFQTSGATPSFLDSSPAGWFKKKDPSAATEKLAEKWVAGAEVLYIGKALSLRRRLRQYRDHGMGKPVGHWGGRYIWQLAHAPSLLVAWKEHEDPSLEESRLIAEFRRRYGAMPFANLRT